MWILYKIRNTTQSKKSGLVLWMLCGNCTLDEKKNVDYYHVTAFKLKFLGKSITMVLHINLAT